MTLFGSCAARAILLTVPAPGACAPATKSTGGVSPGFGPRESFRHSVDSLVADPRLRNSLEFVRSLSGYVTDADGDRLVSSLLDNHYSVPVDTVSRFQNDIGALLGRYRDKRR